MAVMSFFELRKALQEITQELGRKLDILGFDSCAMGLLEIAYELQSFAEVLITPQDFTPLSGWNYKEMLSLLVVKNPPVDPVVHARNFVDQYILWQRDFTVGGRSVEIGACRLSIDFEPLVNDIAELADLLRLELPPVELPQKPTPEGTYGDDDERDESPKLLYSRMIDLILCGHWYSQTHMQDQTVDVKDFCYNLIIQCEKLLRDIAAIRGEKYDENYKVEGEAGILFNKLKEIQHLSFRIYRGMQGVIIKSCYAGIQHQFSTGLSLFFPWSRLAFVLSYKTYAKLAFSSGAGRSWLKLINRFTAETIRPDVQELFGEDDENKFDPSGIDIRSKVGKYDPPGRGALASFREKFGKVKNYPPDETECKL